MKLYIKNMVCGRCKLAVEAIFAENGVKIVHIELGQVTIDEQLPRPILDKIEQELHHIGFELIDDKKNQLIEKVKNTLVDLVRSENPSPKSKLSEYLVEKTETDYFSLSKLFSEIEGTTIEQFYILHKIERVKELLVYNEFTLSEIAYQLGYSSVAHLSAQFKKVTGLTPSYFKNLKVSKRIPLEEL